MEKIIAKELLSISAVFLRPEQPFTWASGIKSPIYCDNRLILTAPSAREKVEAGLAELVRKHFPECECLMGTSTAGIAHAAIVATILDMPMGYVRSGAKDHGRTNRIEGKLEPGTKVVVVEDLISTGGSCIEVVDALRAKDGKILMTADHGNADCMVDPETNDVFTAHTTNPVPLIVMGAGDVTLEKGKLCDLTPTMLDLMGLSQPEEMTGKSLIVK